MYRASDKRAYHAWEITRCNEMPDEIKRCLQAVNAGRIIWSNKGGRERKREREGERERDRDWQTDRHLSGKYAMFFDKHFKAFSSISQGIAIILFNTDDYYYEIMRYVVSPCWAYSYIISLVLLKNFRIFLQWLSLSLEFRVSAIAIMCSGDWVPKKFLRLKLQLNCSL